MSARVARRRGFFLRALLGFASPGKFETFGAHTSLTHTHFAMALSHFFKSSPSLGGTALTFALALAFASASAFVPAFAPRECADTPASAATSGTGASNAGLLPSIFLRGNGNNLNTLPAPPRLSAPDFFFGSMSDTGAPLTSALSAPPDPARRNAGDMLPPLPGFLRETPDPAATAIDARNTQALLADLVQSSTLAPRPRSGAGAKPLADTTTADTELRDIVAQQKEIFAKADAAGDNADPDDLRSHLQQLTQRYDKLLRVYPNYVAGLVCYGQLLNIIGMKKEGAALMSAANNLDGRIPLVKNELGNYCAEEGHPLIAFAFYTAAIKLAPNEPLYYYQLGTLLTEARDTFLKDAPGMWTRDKIDEAMQASFRAAVNLAPGNWLYAYRYGLSYYDLGLKEWEDALQFWQAFEKKLAPGFEQQVARLHQAKILIELRRPDDAQKLLDTVTDLRLAAQRDTVVAALNAYKDSVAHPNSNIEIITGTADNATTEAIVLTVKNDPNLVVTRISPPNRILRKDDIDAAIAKLRTGMTKEEVLAVMQSVSSAYTVVYLGGSGASRICFMLDWNLQQLWVDMGGHDEGFRTIKIGTPEPKRP